MTTPGAQVRSQDSKSRVRPLLCWMVLWTVLSPGTDAGEIRFTKKKLFHDQNEACAIADFNQDGHLDVSAGRNWFPGPDFTPRPLRAIAEFGEDYVENNGEHPYDLDGDGWVDIVAGSFVPKEVYWYRNPGREGLALGKLWEKQFLQVTADRNEITFLRDLDGDKKPEYVANSWGEENPFLFWKFSRTVDGFSLKGHQIGPINGHGIGFGDINGDGREDITFQGGWYERPAEDPVSGPWTLHADWLFKQAGCPMIITDLNEDGRNDMIWGSGHAYGLFWMEQLESKEGKTRWKEHVIDDTWSQAHALAWEDLDNDGQPELITGKRVRAHSGSDPGAKEPASLYYYTWDRRLLKFTRYTIDQGDAGTGLFIRSADLDKNGHRDLVVSGKTGTFIFFNQGPG